jgi:hypothetical protein
MARYARRRRVFAHAKDTVELFTFAYDTSIGSAVSEDALKCVAFANNASSARPGYTITGLAVSEDALKCVAFANDTSSAGPGYTNTGLAGAIDPTTGPSPETPINFSPRQRRLFGFATAENSVQELTFLDKCSCIVTNGNWFVGMEDRTGCWDWYIGARLRSGRWNWFVGIEDRPAHKCFLRLIKIT